MKPVILPHLRKPQRIVEVKNMSDLQKKMPFVERLMREGYCVLVINLEKKED